MTRSKPLVVLLDDSEICLEVCSDALEAAGFEVVTANTALGASRLLHASKPDCVVVDVSMPALSGDRLVEILRRNGSLDVPILLHSDRPRGELSAMARACGATGAVVKSETSLALVEEVRRQLALRPKRLA